jgi:hypothetical protein
LGKVEEGNVFLCESCQVCVNEIVEFVGQRREIVVDVMSYWVHGVKRGGSRSVRQEDRHQTPQTSTRNC